MHILIAIDGSKNAERAVDWVKQLGEATSGSAFQLTLVHVLRPVREIVTAEMGVVMAVDDELTKARNDSASKMLKKFAGEFKSQGFDVQVELREGRPGEVICQAAEENDSDVVVVGSRGLGGVGETLLGSVSHYVTHHAPCPVLVARENR